MENSSPPGRVSPPAPVTGGTKSLLSCRNSRSCSRCLSHRFRVAGRESCPCPSPEIRELPTGSAPGEGVRAARAKATKSHQTQRGQRSGLALPSAPNQLWGLTLQSPSKPRSFPSSFTYVNDDPQEVIVGERRELASLDLLNHFITGTRSEWPLSAGSASPSPSAFI